MTTTTQMQALTARISDYLAAGGLFNPESANHVAVRDLLIECRDAIAALSATPAPQALTTKERISLNNRIEYRLGCLERGDSVAVPEFVADVRTALDALAASASSSPPQAPTLTDDEIDDLLPCGMAPYSTLCGPAEIRAFVRRALAAAQPNKQGRE